MDMILGQLVDLDCKARAIVEEAEEYLETTIANMERDVAQYREAYTERATHRIGVVRDQEGAASERATQDITQRYTQLMKNLDQTYEERHAQWEEELFNKCIGR